LRAILNPMSGNNRLSHQSANPLAPPAEAPSETVAMTRLQRTVARRMVAARAEVPEFTSEVEIEMSAVRQVRQSLCEQGAPVPSYNDFVVRACALALRRVPKLNASPAPEGRITYHDRVNVGVAVAAAGALVVPTIFDADRKSVGELAPEIRDLAGRVRDGSIRLEEMADQTFTVSNLGMYGVTRFTAIVSPPQVGILALGAVREEFAPDERGAPVLRPRMAAVLSADHRVVYGADAAEFLVALRSGLEHPELLEEANDFRSRDDD
jgi:pyruvate dehydrogenase E2 component (dihydrolipoamide acetyltransferase)